MSPPEPGSEYTQNQPLRSRAQGRARTSTHTHTAWHGSSHAMRGKAGLAQGVGGAKARPAPGRAMKGTARHAPACS
eukprot:10673220-Alexandrium_andersonii.AAC.1